jgi:prepilin-type N-terminal cleavage/methylation domain-containing protein
MTRHSKFRLEQTSQSGNATKSGRGFTLIEMLFVVAIGSVLTVVSIPAVTSTMTSLHLGSGATSLASGLQGARYLAISTGCQVQVAVSSQSYQFSALQLTGTPPSCGSTYTYWCSNVAGHYSTVACPIPYTSSEISATSATTVSSTGTVTALTLPATMQFNPSGTVTASTTTPLTTSPVTFTFTLGQPSLSQAATKTVNVSGTGYVKITAP